MSTETKYSVKQKAKEFDEWVSRAHKARRCVIDPFARAKGTSVLKSRGETGLSLIANKYKKTVRNTRRSSRRSSK